MSRAALPYSWSRAVEHLRAADPALGRMIGDVGIHVRLNLSRERTPFQTLLRSIVYQQLSGKAAATIHGRLLDLFPARNRITPRALGDLSDQEIREAGLSANKLKALRDLAARVEAGRVPSFPQMRQMSDEEIVDRLVEVRGVGRWTVEMLLMFRLGRADVLPVDDLGVRKGYASIHALDELPKPKDLSELARSWSPYSSVGSWYCWRATES